MNNGLHTIELENRLELSGWVFFSTDAADGTVDRGTPEETASGDQEETTAEDQQSRGQDGKDGKDGKSGFFGLAGGKGGKGGSGGG